MEEQEGVVAEQPQVEVKPTDERTRVRDAISKSLDKQKEELETPEDTRPIEKKEEPEPKGKPKKEPQKGEKEEQKPKQKPIAPRYLSDEEKKAFEAAPPELQEAFKRREKELGNNANKLNSELQALRKQVEQRQQTQDPVWNEATKEAKLIDSILKSQGVEEGVSADKYVKSLIQADRMARQDPVKYLQQFAEMNSVDLRALAGDDPSLAFDHETHRYTQEMHQLRAELDSLKQERTQQQQYAQQTQQQQMQQAVASIADNYMRDLDTIEREMFDSASAAIFKQKEQEYIQAGRSDITYEQLIKESFEEAYNRLPSAQQAKLQQQQSAASGRLERAQASSFSPKVNNPGVKQNNMTLAERIRRNGQKQGLW